MNLSPRSCAATPSGWPLPYPPLRIPIFLTMFSLFCATSALAQTTVPLHTGYNHAAYSPYTAAGPTSTVKDDYWINIATYPPVSPPAPASSWVLQTPGGWFAPLPGAAPFPGTWWIGARNTSSSDPAVKLDNTGYSIYRKCFCLERAFRNPSLQLQVRADDNVQVWFNTVTNVVLTPTSGKWNLSPPLASVPTNPAWFRAGKNCLYVLVEDTAQVRTGFNLAGTIQAVGLMNQPAVGVGQKFPCACDTPGHATAIAAQSQDTAELRAIVQFAEANRLARAAKRTQ